MRPTPPSSNSDATLSWWRKPAVVYFIAAGDPPVAIKIGVTQWARMNHRLPTCQTSNHELLRLLGVIPFTEGEFPLKAAEDRERELHMKFQKWQRFPEGIRGYEWFTCSDEILDFLKNQVSDPAQHGFSISVSQRMEATKNNLSPQPCS